MTKYSMNPGGPDNQDDTKWYNEQSNRVKGFFELIGFDSFLPNDDYKSRTSFSTIGVGCAKKKVGDYTVIGITVRLGGYFLEWANNVYLGDGTKSDYMHEGWYNAANKLISHLNKYIADYNITGKYTSGVEYKEYTDETKYEFVDQFINHAIPTSEDINK